jgi:hypothetical protein
MIPNWAQTKSFATAVTKHVLDGMSECTEKEFDARIEICKSCDQFDAASFRCNDCGCFLRTKAKWKTQSCPLGKW